ncbi:TonB family C-terminal domain-containing protein [Candidatus Electrothrix laxa]
MNEATIQRMLPATIMTLALHGALLSWRMQLPETVHPEPPQPRKISVTLKRLPPPPPPMKKIIQDVPDLPMITATEHQPIRPLLPKPKPKPLKKIVQKAPALPKIRKVQHKSIRPLMLKPGKKISAVPPPLPKLAPVIWQTIKPLAVQPIKKPEPKIIRTPVQSTMTSQPIQWAVVQPVVRQDQPVISRQQPVVHRTITSRQTYQQPIRRTLPITRQAISSIPVKTRVQRTSSTNTDSVREATPLYQSNPPPEYPRMARRRGLEGVVTIEAHININGRVEELRLFTSSGHTIFDKAALKAVRVWRFFPGTVGGRARSMWVKVPVRFKLH